MDKDNNIDKRAALSDATLSEEALDFLVKKNSDEREAAKEKKVETQPTSKLFNEADAYLENEKLVEAEEAKQAKAEQARLAAEEAKRIEEGKIVGDTWQEFLENFKDQPSNPIKR